MRMESGKRKQIRNQTILLLPLPSATIAPTSPASKKIINDLNIIYDNTDVRSNYNAYFTRRAPSEKILKQITPEIRIRIFNSNGHCNRISPWFLTGILM